MNALKTITPGMRSKFENALIPGGIPAFIPVRADPNKQYANPYAGQANPQAGNRGMGGGGPNRYDYTQQGSGLWSVGIDRASPTAVNDALKWYQSQDAGTRSEIGRLGGRNVNDPAGLMDTIDKRQRDVARNIQKENGFFDSTFGKMLGIGLPFAAGFLGPIAGTLTGAAIGGAQGGWKGALLGGAASAVAPAIKVPGVSNFLRSPVTAAGNVAKQFANPLAAGRQLASMGVGRLNGNA
jgi:hypothetical protein